MTDLPPPTEYFPPAAGRYEVRPGLVRFGTDLGDGAADGRLFQLDAEFGAYRRAKREARAERLDKYYPAARLDPRRLGAVALWMARRLVCEHPRHFTVEEMPDELRLTCGLTGETLRLHRSGELRGSEPGLAPAYRDALDALACQVQEDLAVIEAGSEGAGLIAALHLCFPNHWSAGEKLGCDFATAHRPVAGIEPIARKAGALVEAMIRRGPYVRFAWGLATDRRLNHHPEAPPGHDPDRWRGRRFDPHRPQLYLRVERQVIWGFPRLDCALFTIRTYFTDCRQLAPERRRALHRALAGMSREALAYKGLSRSRADILAWLEALQPAGGATTTSSKR